MVPLAMVLLKTNSSIVQFFAQSFAEEYPKRAGKKDFLAFSLTAVIALLILLEKSFLREVSFSSKLP